MLSPSTPHSPSAFQMTPTISTEAVMGGPQIPHSQFREKENIISIKVAACQKHQVINLLVANVNRALLTQPIEHALNECLQVIDSAASPVPAGYKLVTPVTLNNMRR